MVELYLSLMVIETQMQLTDRDLSKTRPAFAGSPPKTHKGFWKNSNKKILISILSALLSVFGCQVAQNKSSPFPFRLRPLQPGALWSSQKCPHPRAAKALSVWGAAQKRPGWLAGREEEVLCTQLAGEGTTVSRSPGPRSGFPD